MEAIGYIICISLSIGIMSSALFMLSDARNDFKWGKSHPEKVEKYSKILDKALLGENNKSK